MRAEIVPCKLKKVAYFEKIETGRKCLATLGWEYKERIAYYYRLPTIWADLVIRALEKYGKKIGVHARGHVVYEVPDDFLDFVHDIISIKGANYSRLLKFELPETYEEFAEKIREIKDVVGVKLLEKKLRGR